MAGRTSMSESKEALLRTAQQHLRNGAVVNAMQVYYELHKRDPGSRDVLTQIVSLNMHLGLLQQAIASLHKLVALEPLNAAYNNQLASAYARQGDFEKACEVYYVLLSRLPRSPEAHFNLAYYLRKAGRFDDAIDSYKRALDHGVSHPEEVHLNIAVIYADELRREEEAEGHLLEALSIDSRYLPAHYNLANLYEDRGQKEKTIERFEKILDIQPDHPRALSRLVPLSAGDAQERLLSRLVDVGNSNELPLSDKIDVFYALGKVHDERGQYDRAFRDYRIANELNALEMPPYDPPTAEAFFDQVIEQVSAGWIGKNTRDSDESPIFISGMFRSGSTLLDQILASHPLVTSGGERDSIVREMHKPGMSYPAGLGNAAKMDLHRIARRYLERSAQLFPGAEYLTDKRPDNFLYLGLLKALFPRAKMIYTRRNPLDNCLSVYFVRLGKAMNYAVSLDHIVHYYDQQTRLLHHWQSVLGEDLHVVDYETLVREPRAEVERILTYLGLRWDDRCLDFHELNNTVKTASVWQVRRPVYTTSSGRWRNYASHIGALIEHYGNQADES